jgi:hypothetical protein
MHRKNFACSLLVLAVASSLWACSDDESSGNDEASGSGGRAGGAQGGSAGTSRAGSSGTLNGEAGSAGSDDGSGGAGDTSGGSAGALNEAGSGGAGPEPSSPTLVENCNTVCAAQAALSCSYGNSCVSKCVALGEPDTGTAPLDDYAAMLHCQAMQLTAADYECSLQSTAISIPAPVNGGVCKTPICKWTCDHQAIADENVYEACDCGA